MLLQGKFHIANTPQSESRIAGRTPDKVRKITGFDIIHQCRNSKKVVKEAVWRRWPVVEHQHVEGLDSAEGSVSGNDIGLGVGIRSGPLGDKCRDFVPL